MVNLSVKVASLPKKEWDLDEVEEKFWTVNKVVLVFILMTYDGLRHLLQTKSNKLKIILHQVNGATFQLQNIS